MKVVLDTNVIISGLLWKGVTKALFDLIDAKKIKLCLTSKIINELQRVLNYPHIKKQLESINLTTTEIIGYLLQISEIYPDIEIDLDLEDKSDKIFLAVALLSKSHYLITGDQHLLKLKSFSDTKILKPRQFLAEYHKE